MSNDWAIRAGKKVKETKNRASQLADDVRQKYEDSGLKAAVDKTSTEVQTIFDEAGVADKAKMVASTVDEHLDTLSGQRLLQLVEERLSLQAHYNDILATRLDEALSRIQILEAKLNSQKSLGNS